MDRCRVFAPASVANLGPGFDVIGVAIDGLGDVVTATRSADGQVTIDRIHGDRTLPTETPRNTAGIAALEVRSMLGVTSGIRIELEKAVPSGSGLGSSATSAVAGAFAAHALFGGDLAPLDLLTAATRAEAVVSGAFFADNTAPSLLGGAQLVTSYDPFEVVALGVLPEASLVLVTPDLEVLTRGARALLPESVTMGEHIEHTGRACALVAGLARSDYLVFARAMRDDLVEPVRAGLIPGYHAVRDAAESAGADAFTIAGSGPTVLALTNDRSRARVIGDAMAAAFSGAGVRATVRCTTMSAEGARLIGEKSASREIRAQDPVPPR